MRRTGIFGALAGLAILYAVGNPADRDDFRVNDDGGSIEQNHPRVAVAGDGSFVTVWIDRREANSDVYYQRFTRSGDPILGNVKINDDTVAAFQTEPAVSIDLTGSCSAVWKDYRNGAYPFDPQIFFQRVDSSATKIAINRLLTTQGPDSLKEAPDISLSPWGDGVVVWADYRNCNWDVYGQRISATGALIGSNFRINDDHGASQQHNPRVSFSPDGWFAVSWYDNRLGDDDIYVQRFDSSASPLGQRARQLRRPRHPPGVSGYCG